MEDQKELVDLRGQIINELTPLMENAAIDPQQKFEILLLASRGGNKDSLRSAHEAALKIEDENSRLDALMDLLEEVDFQLQPGEESTKDNAEQSTDNSQNS